jgi:hypothetical protein
VVDLLLVMRIIKLKALGDESISFDPVGGPKGRLSISLEG